jgi:hypothetical protein
MQNECKEKVESANREKNSKIESLTIEYNEKIAKNSQESLMKVKAAE